MRVSDWSSGGCSSELLLSLRPRPKRRQPLAVRCPGRPRRLRHAGQRAADAAALSRLPDRHRRHGRARPAGVPGGGQAPGRMTQEAAFGRMITCNLRSEEHTSELQSLMRISYAVFCLKKKTLTQINTA